MSRIYNSEDDSNDITDASWRSRFYGFIREGNKTRLAPGFIKIVFGLIAVAAVILQLVSSFKPIARENAEEKFKIPLGSTADAKLNIPLYDPAKSENRSKDASSSRPVIVSGIQRIRLSQIKGVPTGSEVKAILSSGGTNGTVVAKLTEDLMADGEMIFPSRTLLFGRGNSNDERLYIRFRKAILPDKSEVKIKAQAFDMSDRIVGLKGKKISDVAFKIAASSGLIFLGGLADGMKQTEMNIYGQPQKPSIKDVALNGIATASLEQGRELMNSMKNSEARVEVKSETPIVVVFGDDQEEANQ